MYQRLYSQIWVNISELVNWIVNTFSCHIIIIIILLNSLSYILIYLITYNSLCHSCFGLLTTTTYYHHMPTHTAQLRILLRHDRTIPQTINTNRRNHGLPTNLTFSKIIYFITMLLPYISINFFFFFFFFFVVLLLSSFCPLHAHTSCLHFHSSY